MSDHFKKSMDVIYERCIFKRCDERQDKTMQDRMRMIEQYLQVFNGSIGRFKGRAHLEIQQDAEPMIMPLR